MGRLFCNYPFINNSPRFFPGDSPGCEYMHSMYSHRNEFLHELGTYVENTSSKIFARIRASANTGPACLRAKIDSPRILPACIGFVPGGNAC